MQKTSTDMVMEVTFFFFVITIDQTYTILHVEKNVHKMRDNERMKGKVLSRLTILHTQVNS